MFRLLKEAPYAFPFFSHERDGHHRFFFFSRSSPFRLFTTVTLPRKHEREREADTPHSRSCGVFFFFVFVFPLSPFSSLSPLPFPHHPELFFFLSVYPRLSYSLCLVIHAACAVLPCCLLFFLPQLLCSAFCCCFSWTCLCVCRTTR